MKIKQDQDQLWIALERGEEIAACLAKVAKDLGIGSGWVLGIGVAENLELGFYEPNTTLYQRQTFAGSWEILALTGNLTLDQGAPRVHLHGSFSGEDFKVIGGHFFKGHIAGAGEFWISPGEGPISRKFDPQLNLKLWDLA